MSAIVPDTELWLSMGEGPCVQVAPGPGGDEIVKVLRADPLTVWSAVCVIDAVVVPASAISHVQGGLVPMI